MKFIDTHTHLYLPEFDPDRDDMIGRALAAGITRFFMPNIDLGSTGPMLDIAGRYRDVCLPMIGLHPTSVKSDYADKLELLLEMKRYYNFIAVGEIGIDLYWDKTFLKEQKEAFRKQIRFALVENLPLVIHSRLAFPEIFSVLEDFRGEKLKGVFHAFSGSAGDARNVLNYGFLLGIGGPLTFKNSNLDDIVREAGIDNIVLETDAPYLAPVPYRGKRNESSYIPIINKKLSEILNMDEDSTASITFENSCRLFNISN